MVDLNANVGSVLPKTHPDVAGLTKAKTTGPGSGFADTVRAVERQVVKALIVGSNRFPCICGRKSDCI